MFHVSISHLRVGGVSIQCQYQQKEVYPNQVCMGNDCMQVHVCIPCHSYSETYSDPKLCILQTQFKVSNLTTSRHLACHYLKALGHAIRADCLLNLTGCNYSAFAYAVIEKLRDSRTCSNTQCSR